jgi:WD40 repeat protein/tetratricopeptide (TPR) repeat protein
MSTNLLLPANPFPGLRPFRSDEHHLFFGREDQTAALLQLLRTNRFLAVVGTSGSGKSSLVRAGMIAELHGGTMTHAGSTWDVMILRPGGSPIENLARAMVEADLYDAEDPNSLPRLLATLRRSRFGLVEAMKQSDVFEPGANLLVVVDQFEELFRFRQSGVESEEAATAFVNLLLTATQQAECPIYVTITMRSDYLGDCSEIPGLAEAVNSGEYLIPRLLRDQKRDAIEKPIGVGGAKISPLLVQRLLNEVGDDSDQLPVLQHALMRMWEVWSTGKDHRRPIDFSDFETTGGLASALSNHADEIYDSLPSDQHRAACEKIFKTLTEKGDDNRGIRRPTRLAKLQAIAGVDHEFVTTVLEAYRQSGVTFLMPGVDVALNERTVIDLSHESLMRGWQRLRGWVEDEAQSARIFRRVLDTARLWNDGRAGLFRDPDLQIALSWRKEKQPNGSWAEQYGGDFETAIGFLESSNAEAEAEKQAHEAARKRELEQAQRLAELERRRAADQAQSAGRLRWMVRGLGLVAMVALTATVFAWLARQEARRNADDAAQKAVDADGQRKIAIKNQGLAELAQAAALQAEKRSREFRYSTDVQLAATLVADRSANASQILARLSDHDPQSNPELKGKEDLRGFEWRYLKRMVEDRAVVLEGFEKEVAAAAMNSEGDLVTLNSDGLLQHFHPVSRLETRPALDLKKGRAVSSMALSRDGRRAALAIGDKVHLVDVATGKEKNEVIPARTRNGLLFSPDGDMLITVDTGLGWWDATTGNPLAVDHFQLTVHQTIAAPVAVSSDGLTVVVGGQGNYRGGFSVFRLAPQSHEITLLLDKVGDTGTKRTLAISPDGKTVAVSYYFAGGIALYDSVSGKSLVANSSAHPASITSIAFSPDNTQLLTGAMDGSVKVWKDYKALNVAEATALVGHSQQVDALAWVASGKQVLSAGKDKSVRLWNLETSAGSLHRTITTAIGALRAKYSPDGTLMAVSGEKDVVQIRDGHTGELVACFPRGEDGLESDSVAFSPDNRLLALGFGGKQGVSFVELWDIDRRKRLAVLPGSTEIPNFTTTEYTGVVSGLAFSPDGKHLVAGFGSLRLLTQGDIGNYPLLVYDIAAQRVIRRLEGPRNFSISVAFSQDGSRLASAGYDGAARIWDTTTWRQMHVLENPDTASERSQRRVPDVAFSPDGKLLAMASAEGNVILWNVNTGAQLQTLSGHVNEVWSVAFSPDGRTLASGSMDATIRLWNTSTWRELVRLDPGIRFDPRSLAFSPDGDRLLAAGGSVLEWSVHPSSVASTPSPETLAAWWKSGLEIRNRVRMQSEHIRLHDSLQKLASQMPSDKTAEAALAATTANWHASLKQWEAAVHQYDQLKQLNPDSIDVWWRTPGLVRLATALLHLDRPADAASLLGGGEKRRVQDGNGNRALGLGYEYAREKYPPQLTRVYLGSPAWNVGLRPGDVLLKFNDLEFSPATDADFFNLVSQGAGTLVKLTIQHPGQADLLTVEPRIASYFRDDVGGELIESLMTAINEKLEKSPKNAGLLELRAVLAGLSGDYQKQVVDYTAAIEALTEREELDNAKDLARLYGRRGSAYVGLKQWSPALEDFAKGNVGQSADEELLSSQAVALGNDLLRPPPWTILKPEEARSRLGAKLTILADGSVLASGANVDGDVYTITVPVSASRIGAIRLETLPDSSLPGGGPGRHSSGNFHLRKFELFRSLNDRGEGVSAHALGQAWASFAYQATNTDIAGTIDKNSSKFWHVWGRVGQSHEAVFQLATPVDSPGPSLVIQLSQNHPLGRFRLSFCESPDAIALQQRYRTAPKISDPWTKLAEAYRLRGDLQAIIDLVGRQRMRAGPIGDLFMQGAMQKAEGERNKDWQQAIEIYSQGIISNQPDREILIRRASAYEKLQEWNSAAADWERAAKDRPADVKLLMDFAGRLSAAGRPELAGKQRERAQRILEAVLEADPGDAPTIDYLAPLLLDLSESQDTGWTLVRPTEPKTIAGNAVKVLEDGSFLVADSEPVTVSLPATSNAIRIETARTPSADSKGFPAFKDYRIETLTARAPSGGVQGRFVRLDLPGNNNQHPRFERDGVAKYINLAELQVFRGDLNIALRKEATQSSSNDQNRLAAGGAVDGNTVGNDSGNPYAHTWALEDPWWEVDLGDEQSIERLVVWNRSEVEFYPRMNHFRVRILDSLRRVVFEQVFDEAPRPSREIDCRNMLVAENSSTEVGLSRWSLRLGNAAGIADSKRIRISSAADLFSIMEREDGIADARTISQPLARLAAAYDYRGAPRLSAQWFQRALDQSNNDRECIEVCTVLQGHWEPLAELIRQRPNDGYMQLTQARSLVDEGQKELSTKRAAESLRKFQQASNLFEQLLKQTTWHVHKPSELGTAARSQLQLQGDDSVLVLQPDGNDTFNLEFDTTLKGITGLRLEAMADPRLPGGGPGTNLDGNFVLSQISLRVAFRDSRNPTKTIPLVKAAADFNQADPKRHVGGAIDEFELTGWAIHPEMKKNHVAVFETAEKIGDGQPIRLSVQLSHVSGLKQHLLGRFRISFTTDSNPVAASNLQFMIPNSELVELDVSIGKSFAQQQKPKEAAVAYLRALKRVDDQAERKKLLEEMQEDTQALTLVAQQLPQDSAAQLALARRFAETGSKALADNRQNEALPDLAKARALFGRLAAEHPESEWRVVRPIRMISDSQVNFANLSEGTILVSGNNLGRQTYTLVAECELEEIRAVRLEAIPEPSLPNNGPGRDANGDFVLTDLAVGRSMSNGAAMEDVSWFEFDDADDSFHRTIDAGSEAPARLAIDSSLETGWDVWPEVGKPQAAVFISRSGGQQPRGKYLIIKLTSGYSGGAPSTTLGCFRLSITSDANAIKVLQFEQELKASGLMELEMALGSTHGQQRQIDQAATAFNQALNLATNAETQSRILQQASIYEGVLENLASIRAADASFLTSLARHHQASGDLAAARAAAAKARNLYEQQVAAEPANAKLHRDFADLLARTESFKWTVVTPTELKSDGGAVFTRQKDGSFLVSGPNTAGDSYTVSVKGDLGNIAAIRLEVLPDESLPENGPGRQTSGNFHLKAFELFSPSHEGGAPQPIQINSVTASFAFSWSDADIAGTINPTLKKVWHVWTQIGKPHHADFVLAKPLTVEGGRTLTMVLKHGGNAPSNLGRFRLSVADVPPRLNLLSAVNLANPWLQVGAAYQALGEADKATEMFARAMAQAGTEQGRVTLAREAAAFDDIFARIQEKFPNDKSLMLGQAKHLATQYIAEERFHSAVEVLSGVLAEFPADLELLRLRASANMRLTDWQSAEVDYSRLIDLETDEARRREAERNRAEVLMRVGRFQEGADVLLKEMMLAPEDWSRLRDAYYSALLAGNPAVARMTAGRFFRQVSGNKELDAFWSGELVRMHTILPGLVSKNNERRLLDAAIKAGGDWIAPYSAAVHYRSGNLEGAQALLDTPLNDREFQALGAMLLYDRGETIRATEFAGRAASWLQRLAGNRPPNLIPSHIFPDIWVANRTVWREAARKLIGASITKLDETLANEPDKSAELLERARLLTEAGLFEDAWNDLDRLVRLNLNSPEILALQGRILAGLKREEAALPYLNQAIDAGSEDGALYAARGGILQGRGQFELSRSDLTRSLQLKPTSATAGALADLLLHPVSARAILPTSEVEGVTWFSTTTPPPDDWMKEDFNDSSWTKKVGGFGAANQMGFVRRSSWTTSDIWLRKTFDWQPAGTKQTLVLRLIYDDEVDIYLNGNEVAHLPGWKSEYVFHVLDPAVALHPGANTIAVHCRQFTGGQHIDVGLMEMPYEPIFLRRRFEAMKLTDPWAKLAAAYWILDDQPALDALLAAQPVAAVGIGDLFAAINDWEQAIAAYSKLIGPDTTDASLVSKRAVAYLASEQWEHAQADWLRAVELQPNLAQTAFNRFKSARRWSEAARFGILLMKQRPDDSLLWVATSPIVVLAHDEAAYHRFCREAVDSFRRTPSGEAADRVIKCCLLRAGAIDVGELPGDLLLKSLNEGAIPESIRPWCWTALALLAYRSEDCESAVKYIAQSEQLQPGELTHALSLAVLALAEHQLNHPTEAKKALAEASQVIKRLEAIDGNSHDLLIAEILFREAEAKINQ